MLGISYKDQTKLIHTYFLPKRVQKNNPNNSQPRVFQNPLNNIEKGTKYDQND